MTDLAFATVAELSAAIGNGQLSPVEVVDALQARIARLDGQLHAFVAVHADQARLAAEGAHRAIRAGHRIGPLHGIPVETHTVEFAMGAGAPTATAGPPGTPGTSESSGCRAQDEAMALRVAWAYEAATAWHTRRPPGLG